MAPELLSDFLGKRTEESDIYALAITIWEVRTGPLADDPCLLAETSAQIFTSQAPFPHILNELMIAGQVVGGLRPLKPTDCEKIGLTDALWHQMQRAWASEPEVRPALSTFIDVLEVQG
jgi:hypothetical protein